MRTWGRYEEEEIFDVTPLCDGREMKTDTFSGPTGVGAAVCTGGGGDTFAEKTRVHHTFQAAWS